MLNSILTKPFVSPQKGFTDPTDESEWKVKDIYRVNFPARSMGTHKVAIRRDVDIDEQIYSTPVKTRLDGDLAQWFCPIVRCLLLYPRSSYSCTDSRNPGHRRDPS